MALAIGVKKGLVIFVGTERLEVLEVKGLEIHLRMSPEEGGDIWVDDQQATELYPQVMVSTARSKKDDGRTRLVFEAPRSIKITREEYHA